MTPASRREPWWLREGIVRPRHLLARAQARDPRSARLRWRSGSSAVALTFDDGPDPSGTAAVLQTLAAHRARATFFVLVDRAVEHPDVVHEIMAGGHAIGLHADRHASMAGLPYRDALHRLTAARQRLEDVVQTRISLHRPPFGDVSWRSLRAARSAGLDVVLWSHDPRDWDAESTHPLADRIARCLAPGAVVLLHDARLDGAAGAERTAVALDEALRRVPVESTTVIAPAR